MCSQINLVQCNNLSWFGYPDDTVPSVRATLLPGITKVRRLTAAAEHHLLPDARSTAVDLRIGCAGPRFRLGLPSIDKECSHA